MKPSDYSKYNNYNTLEWLQYKVPRYLTKKMYGEKALGCPQYPFEECPKSNDWWEKYRKNKPYRDYAFTSNEKIRRTFVLLGGFFIVRSLWK